MNMTNDTSTLNGALMELGETMAANLTSKGVTASASDGLTTLAGKILDIQTGGGGSCYHINFTSNSLTYSDWSFTSNGHIANLEVYLQNQYAAYAGQTVTLSDGTNTYTATTNANGLATFTPTITASSTTFTASYTGTSDTITVTKSTFHFVDKCDSSSNLTHYGSSVPIYTSTSGTPASTIAYSSTMGAYDVHPTNTSTTYYSMIPITDLNDKTNYIFECKIYCNASKSSNDIGVYCDNRSDNTSVGYGVTLNIYSHRFYGRGFIPGTSYSRNNIDITTDNSKAKSWYTIRMKVTDERFDTELYDENMNLVTSFGYAQAVSNKQFGILIRGGTTANNTNYIKHIKARSIATT